MLATIISKVLTQSKCSRLLSGDGVTTSELAINGFSGIIDRVSIDCRTAKAVVPAVGEAASIAKNLDEYQFLICSLVPALPDSEPSKLELQKYRVVISAAFAFLASNLKEIRADNLEKWNSHARLILQETSEAYLKAKSNAKLRVSVHKDAFAFFGVPDEKIESALKEFYGQ